jgi:hypothetical protein
MEMELQTSKRITSLWFFAWSLNFSRYSSNSSYKSTNHMSLRPFRTASLAPGLSGLTIKLSWRWKLNRPKIKQTCDFCVAIKFHPFLVKSIVRANESNVVGTALPCINSSRLGWGEQRVVLEMDA